MRVFIGGMITETNTFAPFPTAMSGFAENGLTLAEAKTSPFSGPPSVYRARSEADGHAVIEAMTFVAQPSGVLVRSTYETLRDRLLADLDAAGGVDIILLTLHGAMVADGYDDCEGDILVHMRAQAPNAVIGCVLDPHCHLTETMVETADLIVIAKEYPHTDFSDRAEELYDLAIRTKAGAIRPVAALLDANMIGFYPTGAEPMRSIVDGLMQAEQGPVLSASIAHGFPWGDVAEAGTRVLVYADGDEAAAAALAEETARKLYDQRHGLLPHMPALAEALQAARACNGRAVLGDFADNPGGGAPGDSTFFLRALLERNVTDAAIGAFWDPLVAQVCAEAGVGATLAIRLGGKCGVASGDPVDLTVTVRGVAEHHDQGVFGSRQSLGLSVWLEAAGIDILVCSVRSQVFEPDAFTGLGIDLTSKRLVVVKSSAHYRAGFEADADHICSVGTPGTLRTDFADIPYRKRARTFFPVRPDPWAEDGTPRAKIIRRPSPQTAPQGAPKP